MPRNSVIAESSSNGLGRNLQTQNYFEPDPYWANVVCLLTGEGANGGTTITDVKGNALTIGGTLTTSTTQSRFGNGSLKFDAALNSYVQFTNAAMANQTLVIEAWMYSTAAMSGQILWDQRLAGGATANNLCYFAPSAVPGQCDVYDAGSHKLTSSVVPQLNTWFHIAFVRSIATSPNYTWKCYYNGSSVIGSATSFVPSPTSTKGSLCGFQGAGSSSTPPAGSFTGYVNDFRITAGTDRGYTGSTILIPNAPMPRS